MKSLFVSLSLLLIISGVSLQAQDSKLRESIQDSIFKQMELYPQEKIHLHTDRDIYVPGEKIWFKAYVTDANTHHFPVYSRYVYVELINFMDSLVDRVMVRQENEMFYGHLFISEFIPAGNYTVRAYTKYMENMGDEYFFNKNIRIGNLSEGEDGDKKKKNLPKKKDDYDVSFFPEGGNLLEGTFCRVAFKAIDNTGSSEAIVGNVVDGSGKIIAEVKTIYAGMGSFIINAEKGNQYFLECRNGNGLRKRFKLPVANEKGYTIYTKWNDRRSELLVSGNKAAKSPDITQYLLIHSRGLVLYFSQWDRNKNYIMFKKDQLPSGIVQLLLLDKDMNPLSERLVFNNTNSRSVEAFFSTDKDVYEKREKVVSTVEILDPEGLFPGGSVSIAITDDKDVAVDSLTTITSSLLLSSELKGNIETPAYYLQDDRYASHALDHLMMTHGWRRYNIPEVIKGNMEIPETPEEISKEISGTVKRVFSGKPVENSEVSMIASTGDVFMTGTNEKGEFLFSGFEVTDSVSFFVQALNTKGRPNVELTVKEELFPGIKRFPDYTNELINIVDPEKEESGFMEKAGQRAKYDEDMLFVQLKEVKVTAKIPEKKDEARLRYWANLSSAISVRREDIEEKKYAQSKDLLNTIMGVRVVDTPLGPLILLDRAVPLIIIDGITVENLGALDFFSFTSNIESIDVFKGPSAAVFGSQGTNGAISFTTRAWVDQTTESQMTNFAVLSPLGYQEPAEFYSPKYDTPNAKYLGSPDYRTTIFWKPDIIINENENVDFEFYTSDFATTYSVVIEGLTNDGRIIRRVEKIEVK